MCTYCAVGGLAFKVEGLAFSEVPGNYQPFVVEKADELLFTLRVCEQSGEWKVESGEWELVHEDKVEEDMPRLEIYKKSDGWVILTAMYRDAEICSKLEASSDFAEATLVINGENGDASLNGAVREFAINNATMLLFAFTALKYRALEMHASVTVKDDRGYLFLGKSGTGKSTHSRLWMEAFEDAWLLNDDNPVVRLEDDGVWVYGSPWSGKTPCYKNARARVGAFVRLHQAAENSIEKARPSKAYIDVYSSCSGLKFMPEVRDELYGVIARVVESVPVFELDCLPNTEAAQVCAAMCNV